MEFDETLFSAAIEASMAAAGQADPNGTAGLATLPTDESLDPHDKAVGKVDVHSLGRQTFYPTPNSTNMHADMGEKQIFMSPFPTNYQNYCNVNVGEFDDLLFTPMLSPAMTPMQQFSAGPGSVEVDWDQFDQNFFALTGSAMDTTQYASSQPSTNLESTTASEHALKKQRVSTSSSKPSRQTSPTTTCTSAPDSLTYHHKRNPSMAAPLVRPGSEKGSSLESSDDVSPVDLERYLGQDGGIDLNGSLPLAMSDHIQPITPSMLMSLQRSDSGKSNSNVDFSSSATLEPSNPIGPFHGPTDSQLMPSPALHPQNPNNQRPPMTPKTQSPANTRDIRPRPIAPAHSQSKSVTSSPALGPQRSKPSPDVRPILPGGMSPQVGAMLASKSNYQHIVDGTYDRLNISYPQGMTQGLEVRRTSHKAAEQKRRDHLKESFELMRTILPERPDPGASKVAILKKGYEHILTLQAELAEKDAEIAELKGRVQEVSSSASSSPSI